MTKERDYQIALSVLNGQSMSQVAKRYDLSRTRIQHIIQKQLAIANNVARVSNILLEERGIYQTYIRSRQEWSITECIKYAEPLKKLLDVIAPSETK